MSVKMYNLVILATGIIGRSYYQPGQVIDVIIDLVAFHRGFFAFKICPQNNPKKTVKASCFDQYPLKMADGNKFYRDVLSLCQMKGYIAAAHLCCTQYGEAKLSPFI